MDNVTQILTEEHIKYLNNLRDNGVIDMFEAPSYLREHFGMTKKMLLDFFIGRFEKTPPLVGGDESNPTSNTKKIS